MPVKSLLLLFFLNFLPVTLSAVFAQQLDSAKLKKLDSLDRLLKSKVDRVFSVSDSLQQKVSNKLNAIYDFQLKEVKINNPSFAEKSEAKIDSTKKTLTQKLDTQSALDLPTKKYTQFVDSLNKIGSREEFKRVEEGLEKVEKKVKEPLDKISKSVDDKQKKVNGKLAELNKEGAGLPSGIPVPSNSTNSLKPSLSTSISSVPKLSTQLPNSLQSAKDAAKLPEMPSPVKEVEVIKSRVKKVTAIPDSELSALKKNAGADAVRSELTSVKEISENAKKYTPLRFVGYK
jgi:hypothetical protein